ncbi:hypothetical protein AYK25_06905 [Thermoplasmatales archaeon SM1-50]|nr:MAG: hypothetical protein AYK25_06905 [Thermoplasmatales archaeon SM1-50]
MKHSMKKKTVIVSIWVAIIFLLVSFTSTVAFQSIKSSTYDINSPLFYNRLKSIVDHENTPSFLSMYVGKNKPIEFPLPIREMLTDDILKKLSSEEIKEQIRFLNDDTLERWDSILSIAKNNLVELNKIIRQDYSDYQRLFAKLYSLPQQDAKDMFVEKILSLDFQYFQQKNAAKTSNARPSNITTGPICNITSGWFCQITSQPICQITTQPICLVTKGFFCWTIFGPLCKTTGIKCNPPTSRPTLCSIFATAGKILKTIIIILLLAMVIFVPLAILTLMFITVFNPERCDQIKQEITLRFNCTISE